MLHDDAVGLLNYLVLFVLENVLFKENNGKSRSAFKKLGKKLLNNCTFLIEGNITINSVMH